MENLTDRIIRGQRPLLKYDEVTDFAERGILSQKSAKEILIDYVSLDNAWTAIEKSEELKSILTPNEIESISMDIKSILEILEHEDIVE